jgi:hypothetical protein
VDTVQSLKLPKKLRKWMKKMKKLVNSLPLTKAFRANSSIRSFSN